MIESGVQGLARLRSDERAPWCPCLGRLDWSHRRRVLP
jgi:hypothetical protein